MIVEKITVTTKTGETEFHNACGARQGNVKWLDQTDASACVRQALSSVPDKAMRVTVVLIP